MRKRKKDVPTKAPLCACGCGHRIKPGGPPNKRYFSISCRVAHRKQIKAKALVYKWRKMRKCGCGCGEYFMPSRAQHVFIYGHNSNSKYLPASHKKKPRKARNGQKSCLGVDDITGIWCFNARAPDSVYCSTCKEKFREVDEQGSGMREMFLFLED